MEGCHFSRSAWKDVTSRGLHGRMSLPEACEELCHFSRPAWRMTPVTLLILL